MYWINCIICCLLCDMVVGLFFLWLYNVLVFILDFFFNLEVKYVNMCFVKIYWRNVGFFLVIFIVLLEFLEFLIIVFFVVMLFCMLLKLFVFCFIENFLDLKDDFIIFGSCIMFNILIGIYWV